MNEKFCFSIQILLKLDDSPIDDNSALFQVMAWRQTGTEQYEPSSPMHKWGIKGDVINRTFRKKLQWNSN